MLQPRTRCQTGVEALKHAGKLIVYVPRGLAAGYAAGELAEMFVGKTPNYGFVLLAAGVLEVGNYALLNFDRFYLKEVREGLSKFVDKITCCFPNNWVAAFKEDALEYTWTVVEQGYFVTGLAMSTAAKMGLNTAEESGSELNNVAIYALQGTAAALTVVNLSLVGYRLHRMNRMAQQNELLPLALPPGRRVKTLSKLDKAKALASNGVLDMVTTSNGVGGALVLISKFGPEKNPLIPGNVGLYVKWGMYPAIAAKNAIELSINKRSKTASTWQARSNKFLVSMTFQMMLSMVLYVCMANAGCNNDGDQEISTLYFVLAGVLVPLALSAGRVLVTEPEASSRPWEDPYEDDPNSGVQIQVLDSDEEDNSFEEDLDDDDLEGNLRGGRRPVSLPNFQELETYPHARRAVQSTVDLTRLQHADEDDEEHTASVSLSRSVSGSPLVEVALLGQRQRGNFQRAKSDSDLVVSANEQGHAELTRSWGK